MKRIIISHGIFLVLGIMLGWCVPKLIQTARYDQILRDAEKQLSGNPDKAQNWMILGAAKHYRKDYNGELAAYKKALEIDPNYVNAYEGIASHYLDEGNIDQSEAWLKKGLAVAEQSKPEAVYEARQMLEFIQNHRTNQFIKTMYGK